jgi:hypothetical protein
LCNREIVAKRHGPVSMERPLHCADATSAAGPQGHLLHFSSFWNILETLNFDEW